jgi:nicotinate-nucleotide adenylyltransferase
MKKIGLFGGTFDPPHVAHVALAKLALTQLGLDEVRWIPAGRPWQKMRKMTSVEHREAMVRLAIEGEPRFVLDRCEIERKGPSYTLDTVREQAEREPGVEWYLLIGQDQYAGLHTWNGWEELLQRTTLAVANRPGVAREPNPEVARQPHRAVDLPAMPISSTEIRDRIAAGRDIADLVPASVARYIDQHHLYQGTLGS